MIYPASEDFSSGEDGFLQLLDTSSSSCRRYHPAGTFHRVGQIAMVHAAFAPTVAGSAPGNIHFRGHLCVRFRYGLMTRIPPKEGSSIGFKVSISLHFAIQATGLLTSTPAGLSPAERVRLFWTHNRAGASRLTRLPLSDHRPDHMRANG
jgi:hypothetical protein